MKLWNKFCKALDRPANAAVAVSAIAMVLLIASPYAHASVSWVAATAHPCGAEDDPTWVWYRCGNGQRGVVTMWSTPKVVTCGGFRWLVRHGDLDPHTPRLRGDARCGR